MLSSAYHRKKNYFAALAFTLGKALGWGHYQNNQPTFGLGGHLFWECPHPGALPYTIYL
jgi:hypothetical protein